MNFGPLEFAAYLRRRDDHDGESAEVLAARAAAPVPQPENNRLTIVTGPRLPTRLARGAQAEAVSVFEAIASRTGTRADAAGPVRVVVSPALRPVVLVLSSHQPVEWRIETKPGADLRAVLLAGVGDSRVSGVEHALVASIGGFYAFRHGSLEFRHLEREVLRCTGRRIGNFHSVHATEEFQLGD